MTWTIELAEKIVDEPCNSAHLYCRRVIHRVSLRSATETMTVLLAMQTPWLDQKASAYAEGDTRVALDALHLMRDQILHRLDAGARDFSLEVPEEIVSATDASRPRAALGAKLRSNQR